MLKVGFAVSRTCDPLNDTGTSLSIYLGEFGTETLLVYHTQASGLTKYVIRDVIVLS